MRDINELRVDIDETDTALAALFIRRMHTAAQIAEYKRENGLPVYDEHRERQVLQRLVSLCPDPELNGYCERLFGEIMRLSKEYQRTLLCGGKGDDASV